jgi:alkylglycerol monooxygenase
LQPHSLSRLSLLRADMPLASPSILFYFVDPRDHQWATRAEVPSYVGQAIPWFLILSAVEIAFSVATSEGERRHNFKESICSICMGITSNIAGIPIAATGMALYEALYSLAPWTVPYDSALCWVVLFFGVDLAYYAMHRFCHEFHIGWMGHSVHHSGEFFNLPTALRQGLMQGVVSPFFYLPLAILGLPPAMFVTHRSLNVLYQFWIHTELVGDLGPLEYVLNTPSHHRVHHRPGGEANYAGVLIIWDRYQTMIEPHHPWTLLHSV